VCESQPSSITISVKQNSGKLTITGLTDVCEGTDVILKATGCNGIITWSNGATGTQISVVVNDTKTYTATCGLTSNASCDYSEGTLTLNKLGGSTGTGIITQYLLLDNTGTILQIKNSPSFTNVLAGAYKVSAITYQLNIQGLVVGANISNVKAACMARTQKDILVCNTTGTGCQATGQILITVTKKVIPPKIITENTNLCTTSSTTLTASNCSSGSVKWSTGATTTSISVNTPGSYTATCNNICGESNVSNTLIITKDCGSCINEAPFIGASKTTLCKSENVVLTAKGCIGGTLVWSNGQTGTTITVKPISTSNYTAVCKVSTNCISSLSNAVQIKVVSISPPTIACSATFVCLGETGTLSGSGCEGTIIWSNGSTGNSIVITPDGTTTYSAKCKIGDCESESSEQVAIPIGKPNRPYISCKSNLICNGGETTLTASGCLGTIVWSDGQTGGVIKVSPAKEQNIYSAVCKSFGGNCESDKSNEVLVTVGKKVVAPKVIELITNICPFNTADINTAVLSEPSTNGGSFEFHSTSSPSSPLITSPSTVLSGTYYVFERSIVGCYSDFASIKANVAECSGGGINPNGGLVDISVKKLSASSVVPVNEISTYKVVVKNVGQNKATGIVIRDILPNGLNYVSASGNVSYNGGIISVNIDTLKVGDSTTFTYNARVVASGKIINKAELFKVDQTDNVLSNNSSEYTINDPLMGPTIGVSKICEPAIWVKDKIYNVPFVIYVTNLGKVDLNKVQVKDDLGRAFGSGAKILNDTITITTGNGFVANPLFTGRGSNTNMLIESLSSIKQGQKLTLRFTVKVDLANATVTDFFNVAEVSTTGKVDLSTNGINADPDGDGDPSNNDEPTPILFKLDISPDRPALGIALSVHDTTKINKNCYNVTYMAIIKNIGDVKLTNVQVTDSLAKAYSKSSSFQVVGRPFTGKNSTLKVNPNFDGKDDVNLLIADETSQLTVGQTDSLFVTVSVCNGAFSGVYSTNAYAKAIGNGKVVTDVSNEGKEINVNDNTATVFEFSNNVSDLFIPSGFSPNGDGKNDTFIINIPLGAKIELFEIFNRWGQLVYKDINGAIITSGWDGMSNQGLRLGGEGLPEGTYYFVLKLSNEKEQRVSYLTLAR
jgi:gliding motility-associated-like protein/uncharacterized repeat protein (TIGR01451 family)